MLDFENNNYDLFGNYQRYDSINEYLKFLAQKYPEMCRVETIGKSFEDRDINIIRISSNNFKGNRPSIFVEGGCHAREWITIAVCLNVIHQLVECYKENQKFLRRVDWIVLPLLNVDGYEYSHEHNKNWRKTRSPIVGSGHRGTDLNRNFDVSWQKASRRPSLSTFRGSQPFSESETCALRDLLLKEKPKFYITIHSRSKALLYPFAYRRKLPDTWKQLHQVAKVGHDAVMAATGKRYTYGSTSSVCRRTIGGSAADWAHQIGKVPYTITLEMSGKVFQPPKTEIPELVAEGWIAIREMAFYVAKSCGTVEIHRKITKK